MIFMHFIQTIITICFSLATVFSFAQGELESWEKELRNTEDSNDRFDLLVKIHKYTVTDSTTDSWYLDSAMQLSPYVNDRCKAELQLITARMKANQKQNKEALYLCENALQLVKGSENIDLLLELSSFKAQVYIKLSEYKKADTLLLHTLKYAQQLNDTSKIAKHYSELGVNYDLQRKGKLALLYYDSCLLYAVPAKLKEIASKAYHNKGNLYLYDWNYTLAIDYFLKSLAIDEELDDKRGMTYCFNNIGKIHRKLKNYDKALEYLNRSLAYSIELKDQARISSAYSALGLTYEEKKDYTSSFNYYAKGLAIDSSLNDKYGMTINLTNMGVVRVASKNLDAAIVFFNRAKEIANSINLQYIVAYNNAELAGVFLQQKRYMKAIFTAQGNFSLPEYQNDIEMQQKCSQVLSESYFALKEFEKAYKYERKFKELSDSLFNARTIREITEKELLFARKQEKKIQELNAEKQAVVLAQQQNQKDFIQKISLLLLLVAITIVAWYYRAYLQKKNLNSLLEAKNILLSQQADEVATQRDELALYRDQIVKSMHYAERIQKAMLPTLPEKGSFLGDYFVLFQPRDIVSGDFYWGKK